MIWNAADPKLMHLNRWTRIVLPDGTEVGARDVTQVDTETGEVRRLDRDLRGRTFRSMLERDRPAERVDWFPCVRVVPKDEAPAWVREEWPCKI